MAHSFKLVYSGYPYNLISIAVKLATEQGVHLNRSSIGVDTIKKNIKSLAIDPFIKDFLGLQFTYRFSDDDPYTDKVYGEDYEFLDKDFLYSQQMLFSFKDDLLIKESRDFLVPLFKIVSTLERENKNDSIFMYTGPDNPAIIYKKTEGLISINRSCVNLFSGDLVKMSDLYIAKNSKPTT